MKQLLFLLLAGIFLNQTATAQDIVWKPLEHGSRHLVEASFRLDYGSIAGLHYGYVLPTKRPVVVGISGSMPFGSDLLDDAEIRLWGFTQLLNHDPWNLSLFTAFRETIFQSPIANVQQSGSVLGLQGGFEQERWGLSAIANWNQTWLSHVQHHELQTQYAGIYNGWIGPTGSNVELALRGHVNLGACTLLLSAGKTFGRNFSDNPTFPFTAKAGVVVRL